MPSPKIVFIDPEAALGALTPQAHFVGTEDLGPTPPHPFDDEPQEIEPIEATIVPSVGLNPGAPPIIGSLHFTAVLDEIWPKFDEPSERTAVRLCALTMETIAEAQKVGLLSQKVFNEMDLYKITPAVHEAFHRDFLAYLRRLGKYRETLDGLEPDDTATDSVYVGLVKRKQGAGPVPDCIMHLHFADQLGIISEHADDMTKGFVDRVDAALDRVAEVVEDVVEDIGDIEIDIIDDETESRVQSWWKEFTRPILWAGGILLGTVVVIGGTIAVVSISNSRRPRA